MDEVHVGMPALENTIELFLEYRARVRALYSKNPPAPRMGTKWDQTRLSCSVPRLGGDPPTISVGRAVDPLQYNDPFEAPDLTAGSFAISPSY